MGEWVRHDGDNVAEGVDDGELGRTEHSSEGENHEHVA